MATFTNADCHQKSYDCDQITGVRETSHQNREPKLDKSENYLEWRISGCLMQC